MHLKFCVFLITLVAGNRDFIIKDVFKPFYKNVTKIFEQFTKYDLIIHFDNVTYTELDQIFAWHLSEVIKLVNFDLTRLTVRPGRSNLLHLVYLNDPFDFRNYSEVDYNLRSTDVVLFMVQSLENTSTADNNFERLWMMDGLHEAAGLFILDLSHFAIFNCCFYCGNNTGILKQINTLTDVPDFDKFINRFRDFNGHLFHVAVPYFPPFFECSYVNGVCIGKGSEANVMKTMSEILNFQYNLVKFNATLTQGEWESMVLAVHYRQIDWAIGGISASIERVIITDFTRFIKYQGYTVLFAAHAEFWASIQSFIFVFQWTIFLSLAISLGFIGILGRLYEYFSGYIYQTNEIVLSRKYIFVRTASRALLEQPSTTLGKKWAFATKIHFAAWLIFSLLFTTYYRSRLAALLIRPRNWEPETLSDLLNRDYHFQVNNQDHSVLEENFQSTPETIYKEVHKRIKDDLDFCDSVYYALENDVGVIDEETPLQYEVYKSCSHKISLSEKLRLRLIKENLFGNSYHAWCMQMAVPFRKMFSTVISRMDAVGLIVHWYDEHEDYKLPRSNQQHVASNDFLPLPLTKLLPSFIILLSGSIAAGVLLCCEMIYFEKIENKIVKPFRQITICKIKNEY